MKVLETNSDLIELSMKNECGTTTGKSPVPCTLHTRRSIPEIVWCFLCFALALVTVSSGFNFLPLFCAAFAAVTALTLFVQALRDKPLSTLPWFTYAVLVVSVFLFFLIWGADPFGERLWWNAVFLILPLLAVAGVRALKRPVIMAETDARNYAQPERTLNLQLSFAIKLLKKRTAADCRRINALFATMLMVAGAVLYGLMMNLRVRPLVPSLQAGHDEYLSSLSSSSLGKKAPNVLVILMDDMAYSDISLFSYLKGSAPTINTPNIDSVANGGVLMNNFYAASPVCSPSRFSLLTGRYSSRGYLDNVVFPTVTRGNENTPWSPTHFVNPYQFAHNVDGMLGDEITFAEVLAATGYTTGCIGKWNLGDYGEYLPTAQGFDFFYGSYYVNDMTPYDWVRDTGEGWYDGASHSSVRSHSENLDQSESTRLLTEQLVSFIDTAVGNGDRFMAYYATPWPHYPVYSDNNGNGKGDESDDSYIDCLEEFDKYLGVVFNYLKTTADPVNGGTLYDNTLIVFTSDNGPGREGATGALRGRKGTTFEGGMKVPLIASYPAGGVGDAAETTSFFYSPWTGGGADSSSVADVRTQDMTASSSPVRGDTAVIESSSMNFDLFVTVLSACGISRLPSDRIIDGVDLLPLWTGAVPPDASVHDELFYLKGGRALAVQVTDVETEDGVFDFKYFERVQTENLAYFNQFYNNYLFNLDADPIEGYNLSMRYPEIAQLLNERLNLFRQSMKTNRRGIIE